MADDVPMEMTRFSIDNRAETAQPGLDLERQALPREVGQGQEFETNSLKFLPDKRTSELQPDYTLGDFHGLESELQPDYTLGDVHGLERIRVLAWQDPIVRGNAGCEARTILMQCPRSTTARTLINQLGVNEDFFREHCPKSHDYERYMPDSTRTASWWHITGSMKYGPLLKFEPDRSLAPWHRHHRKPDEAIAYSFLPLAENSKQVTLKNEPTHPPRTEPSTSELSPTQQAFEMKRCHLLILSDGQFIPAERQRSRFSAMINSLRYRILSMILSMGFWTVFLCSEVVERVGSWILLIVCWIPLTPIIYIVEKVQYNSTRNKRYTQHRMKQRLEHEETSFENVARANPMLTDALGTRQMSAFAFLWSWLLVDKHLDGLEAIQNIHRQPEFAESDKNLSQWVLCAYLNHFAWSEAVKGLREESIWLRESAIDRPNHETLARLNTCRSLLARLKTQLSLGRDESELRGLSWLDAQVSRSKDSDDAQHSENALLRSNVAGLYSTEGTTSAAANIERTSENLNEAQASGNAQIDEETHPVGKRHDTETLNTSNIDQKYEEFAKEVERLEDEVQETFQLLAVSIQIKDTGVATTQARRATALTLVATIYLPATLAVGAFGMNVQYLGGDLSIKWPIILFAALFAPSAIILLFLFLRE